MARRKKVEYADKNESTGTWPAKDESGEASASELHQHETQTKAKAKIEAEEKKEVVAPKPVPKKVPAPRCPHCGENRFYKEDLRGKKIKCTNCREIVTII